jgi:uncharacterized protein (DUF4213/DUF364 family)
VPDDVLVTDCLKGRYWNLMAIDRPGGYGLAHFLPGSKPDCAPKPTDVIGRPAKEVANLLKSWEPADVAMGLSCVNASLAATFKSASDASMASEGNAFDIFLPRVKNRKVGVIGHFPKLENIKQAASELLIFERLPQEGDYPDQAAEFLLPSCDVVFITGSSIMNKTVPRLLELSSQAQTFLVGPSVPLCPKLFQFGITGLSGSLIFDYEALANDIKLSAQGMFDFNRHLTHRINLLAPSP